MTFIEMEFLEVENELAIFFCLQNDFFYDFAYVFRCLFMLQVRMGLKKAFRSNATRDLLVVTFNEPFVTKLKLLVPQFQASYDEVSR